MTPTAKKPYWRSASRAYDTLIASVLIALAAYAGWHAFLASKKAENAAAMIAEVKTHAAETTAEAETQRQLAETLRQQADRAADALGVQTERIEVAMRAVTSSLCKEAENISNILATTNDPAIWDSSFNLFWTLHEMSSIEQQKVEGVLTDHKPQNVKAALTDFGKQLGKPGDAAAAREAGLPRLVLLGPAQELVRDCGKQPGTQ